MACTIAENLSVVVLKLGKGGQVWKNHGSDSQAQIMGC
jgi:hypothetical protein